MPKILFWSVQEFFEVVGLYIDTYVNFIIVDSSLVLFLHHIFTIVSLLVFKIIY